MPTNKKSLFSCVHPVRTAVLTLKDEIQYHRHEMPNYKLKIMNLCIVFNETLTDLVPYLKININGALEIVEAIIKMWQWAEDAVFNYDVDYKNWEDLAGFIGYIYAWWRNIARTLAVIDD